MTSQPALYKKNSTLQKTQQNHWALSFTLGAMLGAVVFLLLYGPSTLNPTYDSWIYAGYIEQDVIQHYAGWQYFRASPWSWPLTVADNLAVPYGTSIVFTDSIPWFALLFKVLSPVLPQTFQYFGIYNFLNFVLQGGFAMLLMRHFRLGLGYSAAGSLFFLTMPIFVERTFRHAALGSQWIILAALLCYFVARSRSKFPWLGFGLLATLVVGIHTYFLPMIYALLLAALLERAFKTRKFLRPALYLGGCIAVTLVVSYLLGLITRSGGGGGSGFGIYSMNLNALYNPTSFDWYASSESLIWSRLLPVWPQQHHQYDGFNYLGAGILLGLLALVVYGVVRLVMALVRKQHQPIAKAWAFIKGHVWLILVCLCLAVFAPSNIVVFNNVELLNIPLPQFVLDLCEIFRSSGRMLWPISYLLLLSLLVTVGRLLQGKWKTIALCLLLAVQLFDLSGVLVHKRQYFAAGPITKQNEFTTEGWQFFAETYDNAHCLSYIVDYNLAAGLIRYNPDVKTNYILANRGTFDTIHAAYAADIEQLCSGEPLPDNTMYICEDEDTFYYILERMNDAARGYSTGHYYIIANPVEGCPLSPLPSENELS